MEKYYPMWCEGVSSIIKRRINSNLPNASNLGNVVMYCNRIIEASKIIALQDLPAAKSLDIGESLMEVIFLEVSLRLPPHPQISMIHYEINSNSSKVDPAQLASYLEYSISPHFIIALAPSRFPPCARRCVKSTASRPTSTTSRPLSTTRVCQSTILHV